ncbi:hypothetical protein ACOBQB_10515 [Streptomyces sp. G5(2025)]|uniref:hypothetical protein n=1 Tax=Streptomyces sp. G5(2025) TaxID=3406628 RepID=UPI003C18DE5F
MPRASCTTPPAPERWSAAAVEDVVESMDTTALALAAAHPDAAAAMQASGDSWHSPASASASRPSIPTTSTRSSS